MCVYVYMCVLHPVIDSVFSLVSILQTYIHAKCLDACVVSIHVVCLYTHGQMPSNATRMSPVCWCVQVRWRSPRAGLRKP